MGWNKYTNMTFTSGVLIHSHILTLLSYPPTSQNVKYMYLLMTRVVRASPSISSAIINRGFLWALASSRAGNICWMEEIFFSQNRSRASSNSTRLPSVCVCVCVCVCVWDFKGQSIAFSKQKVVPVHCVLIRGALLISPSNVSMKRLPLLVLMK